MRVVQLLLSQQCAYGAPRRWGADMSGSKAGRNAGMIDRLEHGVVMMIDRVGHEVMMVMLSILFDGQLHFFLLGSSCCLHVTGAASLGWVCFANLLGGHKASSAACPPGSPMLACALKINPCYLLKN